MSRNHRAPVLAFVFMAVVCTVVLAYAIRGNAVGGPQQFAAPRLGVTTLSAPGLVLERVPSPSAAPRVEGRPGAGGASTEARRDGERRATSTSAEKAASAPARGASDRRAAPHREHPHRHSQSRRHSRAAHPGKGHGLRRHRGARAGHRATVHTSHRANGLGRR